jgi:hypothetical protein
MQTLAADAQMFARRRRDGGTRGSESLERIGRDLREGDRG